MPFEGLYHLFGFALAQQTVIDENTGQPVVDSPVKQGGSHCRVDATTQPADDLSVANLSRAPPLSSPE